MFLPVVEDLSTLDAVWFGALAGYALWLTAYPLEYFANSMVPAVY